MRTTNSLQNDYWPILNKQTGCKAFSINPLYRSSAPGESVSDSIAASGGIEKALEELELETSEVATTKNTEKKQTLADLATTQGELLGTIVD